MNHHKSTNTKRSIPVNIPLPNDISLPLEIRLHGRGGQGGVTCAKLIGSIYARLGLNVQTFGDYGAERSGAPIRAFTRVNNVPIKNRNKVYRPDHLLVLDAALLGQQVLEGISPGASILLNSAAGPEKFAKQFGDYNFGIIDATGIARKHGIGTSSVVIINTTLVGAYAKLLDLPFEVLEDAYTVMGLSVDLKAAREAYQKVRIQKTAKVTAEEVSVIEEETIFPSVKPQIEHYDDIPTQLKTGGWSTQLPDYKEYIAPCNFACPAGNDVVGFIQALKTAGPDGAAEILLRTQPLPSVCGRVCPAPCMHECNRNLMDGAVNIRSLERWISDNSQLALKAEEAEIVRSFAVVGGGPAGLSAAYQLGLHGHQVTIYDKNDKLGGVLRYGIPAFRLPEEILDRDLARIFSLGIKHESGQNIDREGITRLNDEYDAVIVCVGFNDAYALSAAGEELDGIIQGLDFLAACRNGDSISELSGEIIVVGGGNTAIDCARSSLRKGASSVKLVYRRGRGEMVAIDEEIEGAVREGVQLLLMRQPVAFRGVGSVAGIVLAEVEQGEPDESGRPSPVVTERTSELNCTTVLLALGQQKALKLLPDSWEVRDSIAWSKGKPLNIWFAGDCATADGTVTHAIGNGRLAAMAAIARLDGKDPVPVEISRSSLVAPAHIRFSHFPILSPNQDRHRPIENYHHNFDEVNQGISGMAEAERCFSCGRCTICDTCMIYCPEGVIYPIENGYRIDGEYCKGCGICVAECPRRAMVLNDKENLED